MISIGSYASFLLFHSFVTYSEMDDFIPPQLTLHVKMLWIVIPELSASLQNDSNVYIVDNCNCCTNMHEIYFY